jgi:hypothetical protein
MMTKAFPSYKKEGEEIGRESKTSLKVSKLL